MKEKRLQRNEKKCVISVNSYYLKNHIYLTDIVIAIILNVAADVLCTFWGIGIIKWTPPGKNEPAHIIFLGFF